MDSFGIENQEALLQDLEEQVVRSLQLLDLDVAGEFYEAKSFAPALVERETRAADFLRAEDFHTLRASFRLAMYWKTRKEIFGERWLLPMSMTGAGTLTPDQVELLRTGFMSMPSSEDQAVFINDESRLPKGVPLYNPAIFFYLHSVSPWDKRFQSKGHTMFHVINRFHLEPLPQSRQNMVKKLRASLPWTCKKVAVARSFDPDQDELLDYSAFHVQRLAEKVFGSADYIIGDSVRSTLNLLEENGMDRACIPVAMGGDYFYHQHFDKWIRARISAEDAMAAAPPIRNSATANAVVKSAIIEGMVLIFTRDASSMDEALTDDEYEPLSSASPPEVMVKQKPEEPYDVFEKRRRAFYAKRSYHKKRHMVGELEEQRKILEISRAALLMDNERLNALLEQARRVVAKHSHHQSRRNGSHGMFY